MFKLIAQLDSMHANVQKRRVAGSFWTDNERPGPTVPDWLQACHGRWVVYEPQGSLLNQNRIIMMALYPPANAKKDEPYKNRTSTALKSTYHFRRL